MEDVERLQSGESVRFTPAQRDALLDMAARLQAEHQATIEVSEIARAAAEAGIDPRFVQEAALRLEANGGLTNSDAATDLRTPMFAMIGLALVNLLFLMSSSRWGDYVPMEPAKLLLLMGVAFVLSTPVVRHRALRWIAPLGILAMWVTMGIGFAIFLRLSHNYGWGWLPKLVLMVGIAQALASLAAAFLASFYSRPGQASRPRSY